MGLEGQKKIRAARVLIVGAGGLGSPSAFYLAAAGVGTLGLVDFDVVDPSNLQRQILHTTASIGTPKLESARERISALNPDVRVELHDAPLSSANAMDILAPYDVILDGTDNFPTRYLVNDACVLLKKPNVYGSVFRFEGQASVFHPPTGPCYRCLYPEPPPPNLVTDCAEGGVLGVVPGIIGTIQALETLKLIIGRGESLAGRLLLIDTLTMQIREMRLRKDPDCPLCGSSPTITALIDYEAFCGIPKQSHEPAGNRPGEISVTELKKMLDRGENLLLLDVREPHEYAIADIGGVRIPVNDLPSRFHELDASRAIVVYCRTGVRSGRATEFLRKAGFSDVKNLAGGINAWSEQIDPKLQQY